MVSSGRRTVDACPFTQGDVRESLGVALATVDVSQDYQRQRLLHVIVAIHPLRNGLAGPVECGGHNGYGFGVVGPVRFDLQRASLLSLSRGRGALVNTAHYGKFDTSLLAPRLIWGLSRKTTFSKELWTSKSPL